MTHPHTLSLVGRLQAAKAENTRLREALTFYAERTNYFHGDWHGKAQRAINHIALDGGERARAAIASVSGEATDA